ncbi:MAG: hypothetical protein AWU59_2528 [Methanolobus sp. T82-4]|nr:MAG: hypothetical protein AWU59_2528 [Methanolobus sp. T82-4]
MRLKSDLRGIEMPSIATDAMGVASLKSDLRGIEIDKRVWIVCETIVVKIRP